jgi:hypothetical protein
MTAPVAVENVLNGYIATYHAMGLIRSARRAGDEVVSLVTVATLADKAGVSTDYILGYVEHHSRSFRVERDFVCLNLSSL